MSYSKTKERMQQAAPGCIYPLPRTAKALWKISEYGRSPGSSSFPALVERTSVRPASGFNNELQLRVSFRFTRNSLFICPKADTISECE